MLATYIFLFIFSQVVEQILPMFVSQRTLYEARERPAKAYSWVVCLAGNIIVELAWNSVRLLHIAVCGRANSNTVDGAFVVPVLVLPLGPSAKRRMDRCREFAWNNHVSTHVDLLLIHQYICKHAHCRYRDRADRRCISEFLLQHYVCFPWVCALSGYIETY